MGHVACHALLTILAVNGVSKAGRTRGRDDASHRTSEPMIPAETTVETISRELPPRHRPSPRKQANTICSKAKTVETRNHVEISNDNTYKARIYRQEFQTQR